MSIAKTVSHGTDYHHTSQMSSGDPDSNVDNGRLSSQSHSGASAGYLSSRHLERQLHTKRFLNSASGAVALVGMHLKCCAVWSEFNNRWEK